MFQKRPTGWMRSLRLSYSTRPSAKATRNTVLFIGSLVSCHTTSATSSATFTTTTKQGGLGEGGGGLLDVGVVVVYKCDSGIAKGEEVGRDRCRVGCGDL